MLTLIQFWDNFLARASKIETTQEKKSYSFFCLWNSLQEVLFLFFMNVRKETKGEVREEKY